MWFENVKLSFKITNKILKNSLNSYNIFSTVDKYIHKQINRQIKKDNNNENRFYSE